MLRFGLPCLLGAMVGVLPLHAADTVSTAELDKKLSEAALQTAKTGTSLFNDRKDAVGCYRLYQGSLISIAALLDHHPDIQKVVNAALAEAATQAPDKGAFTLRAALDAVMAMNADVGAKPLWDRLGGEKAVRAVVHDFVVRAAGNKKVNFFRDGAFKLDAAGVAHLEQLLVELISAVGGGPLKYTGRGMKESHKGMKITDAEFDALAGDLIAVLKQYKVPEKELNELVGAVAKTRGDIVEKPLWDRLGGENAVKAVVKKFVARTAANPKVNFTRSGQFPVDEKGVAKLEQLLVELISANTGGPLKYTGRDMKESHKGMKITEAEFGAMAEDLIAVLNEFKVPKAEIDELITIVASTKSAIVGQ